MLCCPGACLYAGVRHCNCTLAHMGELVLSAGRCERREGVQAGGVMYDGRLTSEAAPEP